MTFDEMDKLVDTLTTVEMKMLSEILINAMSEEDAQALINYINAVGGTVEGED